jgi:RNA polymerase sigma factor (sigma-70 family)
MEQAEWLAEQFESQRNHLRAVAYRMLGSLSEADDAVQEAWLHLSRADTGSVQNMGGWLTTIVARICLDMLRSRKSRREESLEAQAISPVGLDNGIDPEQEVLMVDAVGLALLVVLEILTPAERLAFVLHDLFGLSFNEIAPIVERSPEATRQLASRARRRVRGANKEQPEADSSRQREVVEAFLAASRNGDLAGLLAVLDPDVVLRPDYAAMQTWPVQEVRGANEVANTISGKAKAVQVALLDGVVGWVWAPRGKPRVVFAFTFKGEKFIEINLIADPEHLSRLEIEILKD